jgi:hypothetical protein
MGLRWQRRDGMLDSVASFVRHLPRVRPHYIQLLPGVQDSFQSIQTFTQLSHHSSFDEFLDCLAEIVSFLYSHRGFLDYAEASSPLGLGWKVGLAMRTTVRGFLTRGIAFFFTHKVITSFHNLPSSTRSSPLLTSHSPHLVPLRTLLRRVSILLAQVESICTSEVRHRRSLTSCLY